MCLPLLPQRLMEKIFNPLLYFVNQLF